MDNRDARENAKQEAADLRIERLQLHQKATAEQQEERIRQDLTTTKDNGDVNMKQPWLLPSSVGLGRMLLALELLVVPVQLLRM